ncbi:DinB family protein [Paenibacillus pabuli]|uniref:DinB family protein n=1 Tax=Paenibacillus pabuli TaxID=1472 RepID=UPI00078621C4|nr:DinB family protein [Paenibacillus pabuli]MEC0125412.1 DinB family protein [Paenibacillus pabuli]
METTRTRNHHEIRRDFELTLERYLQELELMNDAQLSYKPSEMDWSVGQMYQHLIQSAMKLHLANVRLCISADEKTVKKTDQGKTEAGEVIFAQGSFPPIRIQVPASPEYTPLQPNGRESIIQGFSEVRDEMRRMEVLLQGTTLESTLPHPRFGGLNAEEWFVLVEMHYRHHLLQLERLKMAWEEREQR